MESPTHFKALSGFTQWYSVYTRHYALMAAPLQQALEGLCLTKAGK